MAQWKQGKTGEREVRRGRRWSQKGFESNWRQLTHRGGHTESIYLPTKEALPITHTDLATPENLPVFSRITKMYPIFHPLYRGRNWKACVVSEIVTDFLRVLGWLSRFSAQPLISAQIMISGLWDWTPDWGRAGHRACLRVPPPLHLCLPSQPCTHARVLTLFK